MLIGSANLETRRARPIGPHLGTLKQTAVDQHRTAIGQPQFMAGARHAIHGPMVQNDRQGRMGFDVTSR